MHDLSVYAKVLCGGSRVEASTVMAKNKKQDRSRQAATQQQKKAQSAEEKAEQRIATPADVARKHPQRRFGHN
ncbi:hypothetical protein [Streptomyces orinoci]|uniref:Uncharacterized protein n=1 Tax=Streptomyces orinoci TaxID=67339 RepID=A0ABV3JXE5_STRON|nr:hypothetical protein [Streptomyces orinoci]